MSRTQYSVEFKIKAVEEHKAGETAPVTANRIGVPIGTFRNWVHLYNKGLLKLSNAVSVSHSPAQLNAVTYTVTYATNIFTDLDDARKAAAKIAAESPGFTVRIYTQSIVATYKLEVT